MPTLAIGWRYLTGHAVATDVSSREDAEWPPHPARVFMALAAAWFETDPGGGASTARNAWLEEGEALRWLESLGDPDLLLPPRGRVSPRSPVTCFVPVNDRLEATKAAPLQSAPATTRVRQPRAFPQVWVGDESCHLLWCDVDALALDRHLGPLQRLCEKVTRIGHSSSLVQVWASSSAPRADATTEVWRHDPAATDAWVRPVSSGLLETLEHDYGEVERRRWRELSESIEAKQAEARGQRGKGARERRAALQEEIERLERERDALDVRPPRRPRIGRWRTYGRPTPASAGDTAVRGLFDEDLSVLALVEGPRLPAVATLALTKAMRDTLLSLVHAEVCGCRAWEDGAPEQARNCWEKIPPWLSGHDPEGRPLREGAHLALVGLPFVGARHADGHLLGLALVFPRAVQRMERGRLLGPVLLDSAGLPRTLRLRLGRIGVVGVRLREWNDPRWALRSETWTALDRGGATCWASATPVVLDRYPKSDRCREPEAWREEVHELLAVACDRVGLPAPSRVEVGTTSWLAGSPRAVGKRRPLRAICRVDESRAQGTLGIGYPPLRAPGQPAPRPRVHARILFSTDVVGPVLLGAGRYRGYGLFRPLAGRVS